VQADDKILVAGSSDDYVSGDQYITLVRYNSNGTLDSSFDGDGKVDNVAGSADSVTVQADGKILVAGGSLQVINYYWISGFALARYNSDGSLDTSFDGDGKVTTTLGKSNGNSPIIYLQADGKILIAPVFRKRNLKSVVLQSLYPVDQLKPYFLAISAFDTLSECIEDTCYNSSVFNYQKK
jgi:uncharacterized delta-60 repeat protein